MKNAFNVTVECLIRAVLYPSLVSPTTTEKKNLYTEPHIESLVIRDLTCNCWVEFFSLSLLGMK